MGVDYGVEIGRGRNQRKRKMTYVGEDETHSPIRDLMQIAGGQATQRMFERNNNYGGSMYGTPHWGGATTPGGGGQGNAPGQGGAGGATGAGGVVTPGGGAGSTGGLGGAGGGGGKGGGGGGGGKGGGGIDNPTADAARMGVATQQGTATSRARGDSSYAALQEFGRTTGRPVPQLDPAQAANYDAISQALIASGDFDHLGTQASSWIANAAKRGMTPEQVVASVGGSRAGASSHELSFSHDGGQTAFNNMLGIGGAKTAGLSTIYGGVPGTSPGAGSGQGFSDAGRSMGSPGMSVDEMGKPFEKPNKGGVGAGFDDPTKPPKNPIDTGTGTQSTAGAGAPGYGGENMKTPVDPPDEPPGGQGPLEQTPTAGGWSILPPGFEGQGATGWTSGEPAGGLAGYFGNLMQNGGYDAATKRAISQNAMGATRASADAARLAAQRNRDATGNEAGFYAGNAAIAGGEAAAMGQQARQNQIDFSNEAFRQKQIGATGTKAMYDASQQEMQYYMDLLAGLAGTTREDYTEAANTTGKTWGEVGL